MTRARGLSAVVSVSLAVCLAACSSSGGSGPSTSQLESKLKKEPSISTALQQVGSKAGVANALISCLAGAVKKDANSSDLKKYVDGKLDLEDVGGKTKGAASDIQADATKCAQNAVAKIKSSGAPAS